MQRQFQFSLAKLMGAMTVFTLAALCIREMPPLAFMCSGCAVGIIAGKPASGFWAGFLVWTFLFYRS